MRRFTIFELIIDLCSVYLYVMPGCFALSCPKNFSAQPSLRTFSLTPTAGHRFIECKWSTLCVVLHYFGIFFHVKCLFCNIDSGTELKLQPVRYDRCLLRQVDQIGQRSWLNSPWAIAAISHTDPACLRCRPRRRRTMITSRYNHHGEGTCTTHARFITSFCAALTAVRDLCWRNIKN